PAPAPAPAVLPAPLAPTLLAAAIVAVLGGGAVAATGWPIAGGAIAALGLLLAGVAATVRRAAAGAGTEADPRPVSAGASATAELRQELHELDEAIQPLLAAFALDARPSLAEASNLRLRAEQIAHEATQLERDRAAAHERRTALEARRARLDANGGAEEQAGEAALAAARAAWAHWLDAHGLPSGLDATGAAELLDAVARARAQLRTLRAEQEALAAATEAQAAYATAVAELVRTSGLATVADPTRHPLAAIAELDEAGRRAEAAQQAQATQETAVRLATDQHDRARHRAEQAQLELDALLAQLGVTTLDEAQRRIERAERADALRRTIAQADRDLRTSIGPDQDRQDAARALLTRADPVRWQRELDDFDRSLRAIDERIDDLTTELAHLRRERDDLERSADVATAELRVADLEAQLTDAVARWATVVTAHRVVEATLARYQRERQPDVIKRAATHFAQVTDGRYPRLEVRDREIVAVDHAEREVHAHQLSKGAAQQLYLCLRFALAESYARTTALPLLLDDVAAHADDGRHPRLAEVIAAVAADHQVLVFTGHDRTVAQLRTACPEARLLELAPSAPGRRIGLAAG
ncbi:MAG: hypothetical protein KDB04_12805, partial [Acidimicrobiales bacterium]|nr:hypothetical protein [Acidimicrobiales bacterium]